MPKLPEQESSPKSDDQPRYLKGHKGGAHFDQEQPDGVSEKVSSENRGIFVSSDRSGAPIEQKEHHDHVESEPEHGKRPNSAAEDIHEPLQRLKTGRWHETNADNWAYVGHLGEV